MEIKKVPNARQTPIYTEYRRQEIEPLDEYMAQFDGASEKPKHKGKKILFAVIVVLLLAAIIGGILYMLYQPRPDAIDESAVATQPTVTPTEEPASLTKDFDSTKFPIRLSYPVDWQVIEEAEEKRFEVISSVQELQTAGGDSIKAKLFISFRDNVTDPLEEFTEPNAVAILASEKMAYERPSQVQRGETYISFLDFAGSGALDGIYVTGDAGYMESQLIPKADIAKPDPIISVAAKPCSNEDCSTTADKPISLAATEWKANRAFNTVRDVLTSIIAN